MSNFILADNQDLTRYALESLLKEEFGNTICYAENKTELIDLLIKCDESIILLDYTLFDFNDEDSLLIVRERFPNVLWILLSEDLTDMFLRKIIYSSHNISIVFKDSPLKIIKDAIQFALRKERYICQHAVEIILSNQQGEKNMPIVLTSTEIEIIKSIAQGKTTKEIAAERFSSVHTINTHRKNIFRKLGVNTAHEAVKYAIKSGLINSSEYYI